MGVLNLWQILGPVKQHQELLELKGQVLAVDLSIWVCETQCVKQMQGVVSKPFLRNLFFRILHLLQLGVQLVFVVEGEAPDLKKDVMQKRQQDRFRNKDTGFRGQAYRGPRGGGGKGGRRNFNACLRECCRMLDCLGIPYLHSNGEAEAFCAALNAAGLVDGCLTNDGDAFLYGARTVYRNFTMNTKDPHVESYSMNNIESNLGLDREKMVAMALLLGCDYLPKGVPGVGVDKAIKLMTTLQDYSILDRFHKWRRMSDSECVDQIESLVRKKALVVQDFPQVPVIDEFLTSRDKCPSAIKSWKRPQIADLQKFALDKMEWVVEYTLEKVLPLVTLWDMTFICKRTSSSERSGLLQPARIVKSRTRQGVQCYEVEWHKPETDTISPQTVYTTIETQDLFSKCYPHFVKQYDEQMAAKKTKGKSRKKKDVEEETDEVKCSQDLDDDLSQAVQNLSLATETRKSQVKEERIQEDNIKRSTYKQRDTEEKTRHRRNEKVYLNDLENNMASLSSILPHHVGNMNTTAKTSGQSQASLVKIENVNSTSSQNKGKMKVVPKVKVNECKKSNIKLSDFTSGLLLDVSKDVQEYHRKDKAIDFQKESWEKSGKQNGGRDRKVGSEVMLQVMICKEEVSRTDEECSEDEEEDYIPLSQRVQINLRKPSIRMVRQKTKISLPGLQIWMCLDCVQCLDLLKIPQVHSNCHPNQTHKQTRHINPTWT
ncbi:flap endonuclease GEN homolog 1-like [Pecten maximus]|uniref:flap endonuclease GEN homolog 1-like n=1 Tax=Pecten maximus TaxID=6579 RepID=UPI0014588CAC|nr:flap endonuclease GEN homolog 1-like [Pecten maximus]XP_033752017.1 flap endonuclease GEN homolog 1-like [Pecten maximus]XP_033752018.1 flap endonuclease GEN homolog 1-like [Pecten maximus]